MGIFKALFVSLFLLMATFTFAQPIGYYNGTENLSGNELKTALHDIIKGHVDFSYNRAKDILAYTDADTANADNVILFYLQESRSADNYGTGGDYINREHVWAKSHGTFTDELPMYSDVHNLRPADASVNEDRSNKDFDNVRPNGTQHSEAVNCWYNDSAWEPGPETKGQVARILFYMATRYEGDNGEIDLELVNKLNNYYKPQFGKLSTLLEWNNQYPPSDFERRRNERVYEIQQNRNPFIDNPGFANLIWGSGSLETVQFADFEMQPQSPSVGDDAIISVKANSTSHPDSVLLYWGNTYDSSENKKELSLSSGKYSAEINFGNMQPGETAYFSIMAFSGGDTSSIRATYIFPESVAGGDLTSITEVQGTTSESPLKGQEVTITGRITANFDNTLYIQETASDKRAGVCVYNSLKTGDIGDSIVVSGTVSEYFTLTEITDVGYIYNFKNTDSISPIVVTTAEIGEDLEGMLVTIKNVTFNNAGASITDSNTSFTFSDGNGSCVLYSAWNSRLVGQSIPGNSVNLTGIVSEYNGTYQILARDFDDFSVYTSAPLIAEAKDEIIVYPNPASDHLFFSTDKEMEFVSIISVNGQLVKKIGVPGESINISGLAEGFYFLAIVPKEGGVFRKKLVVRR